MNLASKFTLTDAHHNCHYQVPASMCSEPDTVVEQALHACSVLYAMNEAVCGEPIGPFQELIVFNEGDRDETVILGQIRDPTPQEQIGGQG